MGISLKYAALAQGIEKKRIMSKRRVEN